MNWHQYRTNVWLWAHWRWLWTRRAREPSEQWSTDANRARYILYKPGWGPWKFLPIYATTYLLGTLWGVYGVSSLSRCWYERSQLHDKTIDESTGLFSGQHWYPWSRFLTRALNWLLPGTKHGALSGPGNLWGSKSAWKP